MAEQQPMVAVDPGSGQYVVLSDESRLAAANFIMDCFEKVVTPKYDRPPIIEQIARVRAEG